MVPMTTTQNIRECFRTSIKQFFTMSSPKFSLSKRGRLGKNCFIEVLKHSLIFCVVVIGTHTNWKMHKKVVGQFFAYITWAK
jgi:hypothetical protein